jgi:cytochrome c peroxidase
MFKLILFIFTFAYLYSSEPISPIPLNNNVNFKKAKLGHELFLDVILSKDNSTACVNCHDLSSGGADARVLSTGFDGKEGNIHSPTVFNARYNFKQFWNGRADNLREQVDGPINNPVEHNLGAKIIEEKINNSKHYKQLFKQIYNTSDITYAQVVDAIVEFEKALTTPNSKFDKFLRGKTTLSDNEHNGYTLFKQYGCITCHNGVNVGGNSFQKIGIFLEYKSEKNYPDRSVITKNKNHKNVFKVPTLRNITLTAPYFHDASTNKLEEAIKIMAKHNLGTILQEQEVNDIVLFLKTLQGDKPKILGDL